MRPAGTGAAWRWNEDAQRWEYPTTGSATGSSGGEVLPTAPPVPPAPPSPSASASASASADGSGPAYPAAPPGLPPSFTHASAAAPPTPMPTVTLPPTADAGARAGDGRRRLLRTAVPVLVVGALAGAAVGWQLVGDDGRPTASAPSTGAAAEAETTEDPATAPGPAGTPQESPQESPSPDASAVPDGYRLAEDPSGFGLAVPEDWTRDERDTGVFYTPGEDSSLIQVFEVTEPGITPLESLEAASEHLASQPGYEEISLSDSGPPEGASDTVGTDAAELVYAYDSDELGFRKQVVDCVFTADDGTMYAVLAAGPADDWPRQREQLRVALAHFDVL